MDFSFVPKRLINARKEIELIHRSVSEPVKISPSNELKQLIYSLVSLEESKIKVTACCLSDRELELLAGYIPYNYYGVKMANLFSIFKERSNDRLCQVLYIQWQNSYQNESCNSFLEDLALSDECFKRLIKNYNMIPYPFISILRDRNIAVRFGKEARDRYFVNRVLLSERLAYFGIRKTSTLYADCEFLYYTFCRKDDYLNINKYDLLNIVKKYNANGTKTLKLFLQNFLEMLSLNELYPFIEIARFLHSVIGDNKTDTKKFKAFFEGFNQKLIQKYIDWINRYKIEEYFGNDERSNFWKQYRFVSVQKHKFSNSVIMEFRNYYAVEFLGQAMGPIYLYRRDDFEKNIFHRFRLKDNQQLRQELYHLFRKRKEQNKEELKNRMEHRGYWQYTVNANIVGRHIAERI